MDPDTEVTPCSAGDQPRATFMDGRLVLPVVGGVASWEIRALAVFGQLRATWIEEVGLETADLTLPREAYVDGHQREWVTELDLFLVGLDEHGVAVTTADADPIWFVLPTGEASEPVWLDAAAKREQAPVGAWSVAARALTAQLEVGDGIVTVEPPQGGVK